MTETTPLYESISNVYNGPALGVPNRDLFGQGVVKAADLAVSAHGGANSVDVAAGACWIVGDTDVARQPTYRCYNDAIVNLGISPDPTNPRRVLIVGQLNDADFAGGTRNWQLQALHGTPAASPVVPAEPASAISLANILVPAAAASSAAYTITDLRPRARLGGQVDRFYTSTMAAGPPANPQDGDIWIATAVDANGTVWQFRYNAGSASAYKWEFIGGPAVVSEVLLVPVSQTTVGAWQFLTGNPSIPITRNGDYLVSASCDGAPSVAGTQAFMGIDTNNDLGPEVDVGAVPAAGSTTGFPITPWRVGSLAAGNAVRMIHFSGINQPTSWGNRHRTLSLTPIRVA